MVEAKSLALICTKDQNSFLFFYLEPKDIFPTKSQMKKRNKRKINKPRKEPPPQKKKKKQLNTFQVKRTNNYPMTFLY